MKQRSPTRLVWTVVLICAYDLSASEPPRSNEPQSVVADARDCSDAVAARLAAFHSETDWTDSGFSDSERDAFRGEYAGAVSALFGRASHCVTSARGSWRVTYFDVRGGNNWSAGWLFTYTATGRQPRTLGLNGRDLIGEQWSWLADGEFANFNFPSMTGPTISAFDLDGDGEANEVILSATRFSFYSPRRFDEDVTFFEGKVQLGRAWTVSNGQPVRMPGLENVLIAGVEDVDGDGRLEVLTYGPILTNVPVDESDNRYVSHVAHGPAYALFRGPDGTYSAHDPRQRRVIEQACRAERARPATMSAQRAVLFGTVCDRALLGLPSWAPRNAFAGYSAFARRALNGATLKQVERAPLPFSFEHRPAGTSPTKALPRARPARKLR